MHNRSNLIQVQPIYSQREEWKELAERYDLKFEVLELSGPLVLNRDERPVEIFDQYLKSGLVTSLHGCFIDVNPGSGDDLFRKLSFQRMQESCELAVYLGAKNVVFHSACASFLRGAYLKSWAVRSAECFKELASAYDLNIFVENSMDVDPDPILELLHMIDNPRVNVCLDIGHVQYSRCSQEQWFEALGDRIGYLHLSDNDGLFDDHLAIGQGCINWKKADSLWRALGRDVPVTIETNTIENVEQSLEYLMKNELFGIVNM
ncbi:MAG: sugar phosphate isomerase/epimerase [Blautia sp.]|nr:sugar phosphate isomerase/epimerase [Blautia sp.]